MLMGLGRFMAAAVCARLARFLRLRTGARLVTRAGVPVIFR